MIDRPIFIDIDGTLTKESLTMWGPPILERIAKVRDMLNTGQAVVIWSGGGTKYARQFAAMYNLSGAICIGKPEMIVDDNPDIRPAARMAVVEPKEFFGC